MNSTKNLTLTTTRMNDVVRARYDKLRMLGARVQKVLGDFATRAGIGDMAVPACHGDIDGAILFCH